METESPRGRIHLIQALGAGEIEATDSYAMHIDRCLVCRACETACPSGVPFGRIMEGARADLRERRPPPIATTAARGTLLGGLLRSALGLRVTTEVARLYQRSGLRDAARRNGLLDLLPDPVRRMESLLPSGADAPFARGGRTHHALGERRMRVALFVGCVMPHIYGRVHEATIRVLRHNGCEVVVPERWDCCGALSLHTGDRDQARSMARATVDSLSAFDVDHIVVNAAGCGSTLKEYGELLADDPRWSALARSVAERVLDVSELIVRLPFSERMGPLPRRVTLQESCHLVHAQRVKSPPREILAAIPELELTDLEHPDICCGSAGIYNIVQPELADQILEAKMDEVAGTNADTIVTSNPGCMLQLEHGVRSRGLHAEVRHLVELLDWSYKSAARP
jgi:glycolate oxidase iron-sulfur subunit